MQKQNISQKFERDNTDRVEHANVNADDIIKWN